ncbi:MAG: hypothetical protein SWH78_08845 [Thermodesulfobacteriota bacterium]|nr:hypothetical protein [Thermodesulfobacteriota bacterium]
MSALLVDMPQWPPRQLVEVQLKIQQAGDRPLPFGRVFGILAPDICHSQEESLVMKG